MAFLSRATLQQTQNKRLRNKGDEFISEFYPRVGQQKPSVSWGRAGGLNMTHWALRALVRAVCLLTVTTGVGAALPTGWGALQWVTLFEGGGETVRLSWRDVQNDTCVDCIDIFFNRSGTNALAWMGFGVGTSMTGADIMVRVWVRAPDRSRCTRTFLHEALCCRYARVVDCVSAARFDQHDVAHTNCGRLLCHGARETSDGFVTWWHEKRHIAVVQCVRCLQHNATAHSSALGHQ